MVAVKDQHSTPEGGSAQAQRNTRLAAQGLVAWLALTGGSRLASIRISTHKRYTSGEGDLGVELKKGVSDSRIEGR
jgi:hypothetical protein